MTRTSIRPGALLGDAESAATPVKGQALCCAPLDRRSASVFERSPQGPMGGLEQTGYMQFMTNTTNQY